MAPLGEEYFPNIPQGVSATVEFADEFDATYGLLIEKTLTAGACPSGLDKSDHDVVLQHLPGDARLFSRRPYAQLPAFLSSFLQELPPLIAQASGPKPALTEPPGIKTEDINPQ